AGYLIIVEQSMDLGRRLNTLYAKVCVRHTTTHMMHTLLFCVMQFLCVLTKFKDVCVNGICDVTIEI
ncbi:MAG: hypothetical protein WB443_15215, partial [Nitrososphaeraceae archaeon]